MAVQVAAPPARPTRSRDPLLVSYYLILGSVALLLGLGLVMVLSSSSVTAIAAQSSPYSKFLSQVTFAAIGVAGMFLASRISLAWWQRLAWPALGAALCLQALVFTPLGYAQGGNRNWIAVGSVTVQPSELVKVAMAIWLGAVLARKQPLLNDWRHVAVPVVPVAAVAIGLVMLGHDLGTAMVLMVLVAGALFVAGVPLRMFALPALGLAAVAGVAVVASDNRIQRILAWRSEDCDGQSACWQTQHGTYALGTGGWLGVGLGASREKWSYLPEAHNDFIFAIIGEELGLVGTMAVLVLFGVLGYALCRVVLRHPDPFAKITTGAVTCWILFQALVNVAVVTGLAPVIGIPLPLVSAGGSALIATLGAIGVVLALIRSDPGVADVLRARPGVLRGAWAVVSGPARRSRKGQAT